MSRNSYKFVHAADLHLDSPLRGLERYEGAPVERIRLATRRALERLVDLAIQESAAFVLLAGDLYDGDWDDYGTGLFFANAMRRLERESIPVFCVSGNHDAANRMTRSLRLPVNVHQFSADEPETICLEDRHVAIHGQSFPRPAVTANLAAGFPRALDGHLNIGLLHTCASGYEGHERYAPCSVDDLLATGYDYWALGHVHNRHVVHESPWIVFPGNLQGRHAREAGPRGCTLVRVEDDRIASVVHRDLDVFRWLVASIDASSATTAGDICDLVEDRIGELLADNATVPIALRLEVHGQCAAHEEIAADPERWSAELQSVAAGARSSVWLEKVRWRTTTPRAPAPLGEGAVGELLAFIDELRGEDDLLVELAAAVSTLRQKLPGDLRQDELGRPIDDPEHLRDALEVVGPLLLARLRKGKDS